MSSSLAQATVAVSEACSIGLVGLRQQRSSCWQEADSILGETDLLKNP